MEFRLRELSCRVKGHQAVVRAHFDIFVAAPLDHVRIEIKAILSDSLSCIKRSVASSLIERMDFLVVYFKCGL
jgi:hypothetical protein